MYMMYALATAVTVALTALYCYVIDQHYECFEKDDRLWRYAHGRWEENDEAKD